MGRKGFTLMEVLAAIAILSLVLGIAGRSVVGIVNNSKERSEILFVDKIDKAIDEYISLEGGKLVNDKRVGAKTYNFSKCKNAYCSETKIAQAYELLNGGTNNVRLSVILDLFEDEKLTNPVNKLNCLDGVNPVIRIFKDSDYVYYYYVNVGGSNTSCEIKVENGIINTLPDNLKSEVGL